MRLRIPGKSSLLAFRYDTSDNARTEDAAREEIEKIVGVMVENRGLGLDLAVIDQRVAVYC
jgi:hypothetical protein